MREPDPDQHAESCRDEGENQDLAERDRNTQNGRHSQRKVGPQRIIFSITL